MKKVAPTLKNEIIDTAINIAQDSSWEKVRLVDIAKALNIDLNTIRYFFAEKDQIIDACFDRADETMLNAVLKPKFDLLTAKEKLYDLLMNWLSAFEGKQKVIRQMILHKLEPGHLHLQLPAIKRISQTVQWWREAAGLREAFPQRAIQETGLTIIYLSTFSYWLLDNSKEHLATRIFLENKLNTASVLSNFLGFTYYARSRIN
ncbi:TetR/AcrR family transcriptional regulator [Legionella pneumophila]|uniref:Bacterial regulatory protein n=1 Tax=Legionella pneumophila subsp. pascullei TaxID=91890 RepID=A0AAX2IWK6_LEGPN|nr:TetR/AcrR family transcriptional regulator [Legionella pneumophila]AMP90154.1 TetR family transcriptional regulator [Legionella pneumophila subsp. pascullei]AMP92177.1 TetR family transcriptional regulator [Legionella pneumophila subsp. pascullei]AMP95143.1 TetR family transcriptional regulator [Legionella pneumophila subsp. pascullei]SQG90024.1 bacterial regulatory protein [Legionella pneumophila subsp. pascullei]VEH05882.1 bacterial regulatory protein [Legionella pneumophila subsp. pascul